MPDILSSVKSNNFFKKKLSPKAIIGIVVFLLVVIGLGAALVLININQDVRQQAAGGDDIYDSPYCQIFPNAPACIDFGDAPNPFEPVHPDKASCDALGGTLVGDNCTNFKGVTVTADFENVDDCLNSGRSSTICNGETIVYQNEIDECNNGGGTMVGSVCIGGSSGIGTTVTADYQNLSDCQRAGFSTEDCGFFNIQSEIDECNNTPNGTYLNGTCHVGLPSGSTGGVSQQEIDFCTSLGGKSVNGVCTDFEGITVTADFENVDDCLNSGRSSTICNGETIVYQNEIDSCNNGGGTMVGSVCVGGSNGIRATATADYENFSACRQAGLSIEDCSLANLQNEIDNCNNTPNGTYLNGSCHVGLPSGSGDQIITVSEPEVRACKVGGGIIINGICTGGRTTLQNAYNNSSACKADGVNAGSCDIAFSANAPIDKDAVETAACTASGGILINGTCEGTSNPNDRSDNCGGDKQASCDNNTNQGCDSGMVRFAGQCLFNNPNYIQPQNVCWAAYCGIAIGPSDPNTGIISNPGATQSLPSQFVLRADGEFDTNMRQIIEDLTDINNNPNSRCNSGFCNVAGYNLPSGSLLGSDGFVDKARELVYLQELDNRGVIDLDQLLADNPNLLESITVTTEGRATLNDQSLSGSLCNSETNISCGGAGNGLAGAGFDASIECDEGRLCCRLDGCCVMPEGFFGVVFSQNNIDYAPGTVGPNYEIVTGSNACITSSSQVQGQCGEIQLDIFAGSPDNFSVDGLGPWYGEGYARSGLFTSYVGDGTCSEVGGPVSTPPTAVVTVDQPGGSGGGNPPVNPPPGVYTCGSSCTSDSQCQQADSRFICSSEYGNTCRLASNPESPQCQPATGPQCISINMTNVSNPNASATDDPELGDAVNFTCGVVAEADHYIFRVIEPNGTIVDLQATGRTSETYTIDQEGGFAAQCQICTGAANSTCLPYEDPYNQPTP